MRPRQRNHGDAGTHQNDEKSLYAKYEDGHAWISSANGKKRVCAFSGKMMRPCVPPARDHGDAWTHQNDEKSLYAKNEAREKAGLMCRDASRIQKSESLAA